jgi:hypothetical protein
VHGFASFLIRYIREEEPTQTRATDVEASDREILDGEANAEYQWSCARSLRTEYRTQPRAAPLNPNVRVPGVAPIPGDENQANAPTTSGGSEQMSLEYRTFSCLSWRPVVSVFAGGPTMGATQ